MFHLEPDGYLSMSLDVVRTDAHSTEKSHFCHVLHSWVFECAFSVLSNSSRHHCHIFVMLNRFFLYFLNRNLLFYCCDTFYCCDKGYIFVLHRWGF